jgi:hypothetical protein
MFEKASLIPFNPQRVLTKLAQFNNPEQPTDTLQIPYNYNHPSILPNNSYLLKILDKLSGWIQYQLDNAITQKIMITPTVKKVIGKRDKAVQN